VKRTGLVVLIALAGCVSHHVDLDPKFSPLTRLDEPVDASLVLKPLMVTTIYGTSYTASVASLSQAYGGVGSVPWDALFFHEQVHAKREFANPEFLVRYVAERSFRWHEEQLGYEVEITYLRAHGWQVDLAGYATTLSSAYDGMVSYNDALAWLKTLK